MGRNKQRGWLKLSPDRLTLTVVLVILYQGMTTICKKQELISSWLCIRNSKRGLVNNQYSLCYPEYGYWRKIFRLKHLKREHSIQHHKENYFFQLRFYYGNLQTYTKVETYIMNLCQKFKNCQLIGNFILPLHHPTSSHWIFLKQITDVISRQNFLIRASLPSELGMDNPRGWLL